MKNKKFFLINLFWAIALAFIWAETALASAFDTILQGFSSTGKSAGYSLGADGKPAVEFVPAWTRYLNGMLLLMGALFMINVIYAGFLWFSAKGNEEQVTRSKSLMINAFIGLAIIIGALIIVQVVLFVLGQTIKTA